MRQVDRILAELLMAQFARVNQMMGEDLNTSLQELFSVVEEYGETLLEELKTALGPTVSNLVPYNLQQVVESHNSHLYMSLTKVLVFLDCVRWEGQDLLEDRVKSLQSSEEFKKLITAPSEQISAFEDRIWELALSEELAEEEVALWVNLALTATRPIVGNYFSGVVEGLIWRLGIKVHEDENPPPSTQEGLEKCLTKELQQSSTLASSLEGCESRGLHVRYSLEYADSGKGPHVPALSSTTLPNLLDAIDHLQLCTQSPPKEAEPPEEQHYLLKLPTVKKVPKPLNTKDIYEKFLNVLGEWSGVQNPDPTPKPGNTTSNLTLGDQPIPPGQAAPLLPPGHVDAPPNPGVPRNSDWEPGKIPTNEEEPKKLFSYRNPLYNKPSAPRPKVSDPIPPIPCGEQKAGGEGSKSSDLTGLGGVPPSQAGNSPMGHSQGDPSFEKVPEQEASSQKVAKPTKNILHPSRLPWRILKYTDGEHTILDPKGHPIGRLRLTDVVKSEKGSMPGGAKCKEPNTPALGSVGASAPVWKQVKFKGVRFHHGSTCLPCHRLIISWLMAKRRTTTRTRRTARASIMVTLEESSRPTFSCRVGGGITEF